jgi:hypothetical protein
MYLRPQLGAARGGTYYNQAPLSRRPRRRGLVGLSSITADDAAKQVMPTIQNKAGFGQSVYDGIVRSAAQGNFTEFNPTGCAGVKPLNAVLASTGGGLALKFAPAAFGAGPLVGGVVLAVGVIGSLFGMIFSHHAAAVAKERSVICAAVPAASDSLTAIDGAVQNGTFSPAAGIQGLNGVLASFTQTVQSILKMDSSHCNAACVWIKTLQAIVAKKTADYQDLAAAQSASPIGSASVTNVVQSIEQSTGLPPALLAAAAFGLLWYAL